MGQAWADLEIDPRTQPESLSGRLETRLTDIVVDVVVYFLFLQLLTD